MKFPNLTLPPLLMLLFPFAILATGNGSNTVDESGMRQGHWTIRGYMVNEPGYEAAALVEEGNYVDNRKEGVWKKYNPAGWLRSEITYANNRPQGPYIIYYSNGQIEEKGSWNKNMNTGDFERYYQNGNLQQKFIFTDDGKRNGLQQYFHENGQLELIVEIVDGKEEGVMTRYHADGSLKEKKTLNGGVLDSGSIQRFEREVATEELDFTAEEMVDIPSDAPESASSLDQPNEAHTFRPNGYNILYNKGQQVTQIGDFRNGRLWNGKWHRYNGDGILVRIEIYKAGRYVGTGVFEDEGKP